MLHEDLLFNSSSLGKHIAAIKNYTFYLKQTMDWMSSNKAEDNVSLKLSAEDELSRFRHKMLSRSWGVNREEGSKCSQGKSSKEAEADSSVGRYAMATVRDETGATAVVHGQRS